MTPDPTKIPIRASTQAHLDIEDIREDLVILKDGGAVLVLATTAINFSLLSEKEQEATIFAYAGLLNSLTFPIQLVIRSQRKDVSNYLKLIDQFEAKETREKIKDQIRKYKAFIRETVAKNEVLDKKFYLAIPMSHLEMGVSKTIRSGLKKANSLPFSKKSILKQAKIKLYPKRDHLLRQLSRLGLKARQLTSSELIKLFFEIYNPESSEQTTEKTEKELTPLVQAEKMEKLPLQSNEVSNQTNQPGPETEKSLRQEINHLVDRAK